MSYVSGATPDPITTTRTANPYLARVTAVRTSLRRLELLLKTLQSERIALNAQVTRCQKSGGNCTGMLKQRDDIDKAISACSSAIRNFPAPKTAPTTVTKAVEATKAGVAPSGTVAVSPDAAPVAVEVRPADIVVSDGTIGVGIGTIAVAGILGFIGYRMAKKKGWV